MAAGRIPIPNLSLGSVQQAPSPSYASADTFGADNARAMQQAGADLTGMAMKFGTVLNEEKRIQDNQDTAAAVAGFDFSKAYAEERMKAPAGGADFQTAVLARYDTESGAYLDQISGSRVRDRVRTALLERRNAVGAHAAEFELTSQQTEGRRLAGDALQTVENRVRSDPGQYQLALNDGLAVIDSQSGHVAADVREAMKNQFRGNLALRRFESLASKATTAGELNAVVAELEADPKQGGVDWKKEFKPHDYDRLLDQMKTQARTFDVQARSEARAGLAGLTDRNRAGDNIPEPELAEVKKRVMATGDTGMLWHLAEIERQQQVYRNNRGAPPSVLRERITAGRAAGVAGLPEPVQQGIAQGSSITGGAISQDYLARMVKREYGGYLTGPNPDYGRQTGILGPDGRPTSDATGVAQIISPTFLSIARKYATALSIDPNMSDADLLKLRADPKISIQVAALYAKDNKAYLEPRLGRPVTDTDLDFAHFLGAGGAETFLKAAGDPKNAGRPASDFVSAAAVAANKPVFFDAKGAPITVSALYGKFAIGQDRVSFAETQAYERLYAQQQAGLRDDPMTYLMKTGRHNVQPLTDDASYAQRGNLARAASSEYQVPLMKPLTKDEVESMSAVMKNGTGDDKLRLMTQLQTMGPDVAKVAYAQLGEKDGLFALAAGLAYERNQFGVAADIVRGETRMKNDKEIEAIIGSSHSDIAKEFTRITDRAFMGVSPADAAALRQAAIAHYVETYVARGNAKVGKFDRDAFTASVNAVTGSRIDDINGEATVVPQGMTGRDFDKALDRMTPADYVRMSVDGSPPRFADGKLIDPQEIAREAHFRAIGGNQYRLQMADGRFAVTGQLDDTGQARLYLMKADPQFMKEVLARPAAGPVGPALPPMTPGVTPAGPRVIGPDGVAPPLPPKREDVQGGARLEQQGDAQPGAVAGATLGGDAGIVDARQYPNAADVNAAVVGGAGYETPFASFLRGDTAKTLSFDSVRGDTDKIDELIKRAKIVPGDAKTRQVLMAGYMAANRSAIAGLGFDPREVGLTTDAGKTTVGGLTFPDSGRIWSNAAAEGNVVHESIHRGFSMLRTDPDTPSALKAWLNERPLGSRADFEELAVRYIMAKTMGNIEMKRDGGAGELGQAQIDRAIKIFEEPGATGDRNRRNLADLEERATMLVKARHPFGGPR